MGTNGANAADENEAIPTEATKNLVWRGFR